MGNISNSGRRQPIALKSRGILTNAGLIVLAVCASLTQESRSTHADDSERPGEGSGRADRGTQQSL
jgi:hypothetical protein